MKKSSVTFVGTLNGLTNLKIMNVNSFNAKKDDNPKVGIIAFCPQNKKEKRDLKGKRIKFL